jgi:homoserine dehydrogenase
MDYPLKPADIQREGIRGLSGEMLATARMTLAPAVSAGVGRPYKLVCQAEHRADGSVLGSVRPEQVPLDDALARCDGATSIITFQMDVIHVLTLSEMHPDAVTTAYGPLADLVAIARGELR